MREWYSNYFDQEEITKSLVSANRHKAKQEAQQEDLKNLTDYLMESGQEPDRDRAEAKARPMLKFR